MRRRRHIPAALFGVSLTLMFVAAARPRVHVRVAHREGTAVLAFDVSSSMRATDVKPTRLAAAQHVARVFVRQQPATMRTGVVAFNGGGVTLQRPTTERSDVLAAIDRLRPNGSTSLGQGMFSALSAIAGAPLAVQTPMVAAGAAGPLTPDRRTQTAGANPIPYLGAAMVLFSDGENTATPDPMDIARLASVAGVRIYTVGLGLPAAIILNIDGFRVATALDEAELMEIARVTNGTYLQVGDEAALAAVYRSISLRTRAGTATREITSLMSVVGLALLSLGSALAMRWYGRML